MRCGPSSGKISTKGCFRQKTIRVTSEPSDFSWHDALRSPKDEPSISQRQFARAVRDTLGINHAFRVACMAISLRVLCAFAVRLRNPGSYQGPPEEGFSPSRKARKGQARSGSGITNRLEIHLLELPKYAPLDDNPPIADPRDPSSERKTVVHPWKKFATCIESPRLAS